jgi:hypothetical protein
MSLNRWVGTGNGARQAVVRHKPGAITDFHNPHAGSDDAHWLRQIHAAVTTDEHRQRLIDFFRFMRDIHVRILPHDVYGVTDGGFPILLPKSFALIWAIGSSRYHHTTPSRPTPSRST